MNTWPQRRVPASLQEHYEATGWWTDRTLGAMVAQALAATPSSTVNIWSRTREWHGTYADIDVEARQLVALLQHAGVQPGEAVAFQLPNWREAVVAFAALAMGGYVLIPIVHIYGHKEVSFILQQSSAVAYISPMSYGHVNYADIIDQAEPDSLRAHIVVGEEPLGAAPQRVGRLAWGDADALSPVVELPQVDAEEVVVLAYTSGTTSDPKGVIHSHQTLLSELAHMEGWITPGRPNLMGSPVTHATGMLGAVLGPLKSASDIHLIDRWDPQHALEVMLKAGIGGGTGAYASTTSGGRVFVGTAATRMTS